MRDETDILHYEGGDYAWERLTDAEKIEDLEKRMSTCAHYIEAWTDAYRQLKEQLKEQMDEVTV
jgi:hypothetical protein